MQSSLKVSSMACIAPLFQNNNIKSNFDIFKNCTAEVTIL